MNNNPLINRPKHKHGAIDFDAIKLEHFMPALNHAINTAEYKLQQIKNNPSQPNWTPNEWDPILMRLTSI